MQSLPMDGESLAVLAEYGLGEARLSGCHLRRYEAGEAMVRQNEAMDALLFVRSGNAKVCINARNGRTSSSATTSPAASWGTWSC